VKFPSLGTKAEIQALLYTSGEVESLVSVGGAAKMAYLPSEPLLFMRMILYRVVMVLNMEF